MIPSAVVGVAELPLTPSGKVDLARLPDPAPPAAVDEARPASELERTVAAAWCAVLGVERVGMNANFFEIGGHSLLLARLQEEMETRLSRRVELVDVFRYPTVRQFVAHVLSGQVTGDRGQQDGDAFAPASAAPPAAEPKAEGARRGEDRGAARRAAVTRRR